MAQNFHLDTKRVREDPMLVIRCFGMLEVTLDDRPLAAITRSPVLSNLLAYLVLHRQACPRLVLAALLWPDAPEERARRNLNTHLWRLRRLLEPKPIPQGAFLSGNAQSIRWNPQAPVWLDVTEFEQAVDQFSRIEPDRLDRNALDSLENAVALYRGDLLEGLYSDWCLPLREHLHEKCALALETLQNACFAAGDLPAALAGAQRWLQIDPWSEAARARYIQILLRMGQAGKARQSWQDYQRQWQEAFGLEPSPAMVALSAELDAAGDKAAQTPGVSVEAPGMTAPSPDSEPAALLDDHRQFARIATQLGLFHQGRFANAAALEYLTLALHSLDELPSTPEVQRQALALRFRCDELYDLLAKRDLQMENLTEAWKVADALGDAPTKAEVLARQIWLYRALGDLSSVSGHVQQAVALLPEIPSSQQALIHRLAGMVAEHAGDLLAAHRSYTQALTLDEADQNREAALADLINLMGVCTSMGYYARALTLSAQAEEILPICSNLHLETVLQGMQGRLWLQLGDFSTARQLTSQALRAARRAGYVQIELWLTWVRAALYQAQGNHQHALLIATHAYRRAQEMRLPRESVLLADLVADLHLSLEQPDLALAWVDGLAEQAAHSGYQAYMLRADWHRCRALLALGKIPEALTLACQLIETYQARAQPLEEAPSLFRTLSSCAHIAGDMIQAEWAEQQSQQALLGMAKDLPAAGLRDRFLQMWGNERRQVMPGSQ